jgi:TIR domain/Helix-turn-helix domain
MVRFGDELRRRSRAAGVGTRGLARLTGLDEATIASIEDGIVLPSSEGDLRNILSAARATPARIARMLQAYRDLLAQHPASPPPGVFLSYRRADDPAFAGRLADRLVAAFGAERVFFDVDTIGLGRDFVEQLDVALASCAVLVAVIGPRWVVTDGVRRLDDPGDFVRLEIARTLARGIPVIPVLVDGVGMPAPGDLPDVLAPFARRQAHTITNARFGSDCRPLLAAIERLLV